MRVFYKVTIITACICVILGSVIAIVSLASGGKIIHKYVSNYKTSDFIAEYEDVKSIDFTIAAANVEIVTDKGNKFKIEATDIPEDVFYSKVEDGKWIIGYDKKYRGWRSIFDWGYDLDTTIKITIPEDHFFDNAIIEGGAADIDIESLSSKKVFLEIGAGDLKVNKLDTNNLEIDTGVGETVIKGKVDGDIDIDCGVGNVELTLTSKQDDYNYNIDVGIGNVSIGTINIAGAQEKNIDNDANYNVKIDCGVGNVDINFKGE